MLQTNRKDQDLEIDVGTPPNKTREDWNEDRWSDNQLLSCENECEINDCVNSKEEKNNS